MGNLKRHSMIHRSTKQGPSLDTCPVALAYGKTQSTTAKHAANAHTEAARTHSPSLHISSTPRTQSEKEEDAPNAHDQSAQTPANTRRPHKQKPTPHARRRRAASPAASPVASPCAQPPATKRKTAPRSAERLVHGKPTPDGTRTVWRSGGLIFSTP